MKKKNKKEKQKNRTHFSYCINMRLPIERLHVIKYDMYI